MMRACGAPFSNQIGMHEVYLAMNGAINTLIAPSLTSGPFGWVGIETVGRGAITLARESITAGNRFRASSGARTPNAFVPTLGDPRVPEWHRSACIVPTPRWVRLIPWLDVDGNGWSAG